MLNILTLIMVYLFVFSSLFIMIKVNKRDFISPLVIIPFFSFFYLPGWIYHSIYLNQEISYKDFYLITIAILFIISFTIGGFGKKKEYIDNYSILELNKIKLTAFIMFFISTFLFFVIFQKEGVVFFISGKGVRNLLYAHMGFEKFAKDLMIPAGILIIFYYTKIKDIKSPVFILIMFFIFVLFILLEVRSGLAILIFSFLYFYNRHIKKIKNIYILIILLFLLFMGSIAKEIFYNSRLYITQGEFHPDILKAIAHTFIQHEFYAWFEIFQNLSNELVGGETFYKSIKSFFYPHFLGGESFSPTEWYAKTYLPDIASKGFGRGFSFLVEIYINFNIMGVIIFGYLFGRLLKKLEDSKYYFIAMFFSAIFPFVWTGNSAILLKQYFAIYFLPPFLIYQALKLLPTKKRISYARI